MYAPAIEHWQRVLGRPAPYPTRTGRHGRPVLSPAFSEFMMGLEAGWLTDLPIPRTAQLRALGNGVVPQQAAHAVRLLLADLAARNLPFHGYAHNQLWLEIVALACDLLAWTQTLAWEPHQPARRWEPKRLRLRILAVAGRIVRTARRQRLRLPRNWPWNQLIHTGYAALLQPA